MRKKNISTLGRITPSYAYELEFRKRLNATTEEMRVDVEREIIGYYDSDVAQDSVSRRLIQILKALRLKWYRRYEKIGKEMTKWFMETADRRTRKEIMKKLKEVGFAITPNYTEAQKARIKELADNSVKMIKSIPQRYLANVQKVVSNSIIKGGDREAIAKTVAKIAMKLGNEAERAKNMGILIARDQSNKITQNFAIENAKAYGITRAKWVHVPGTYSARITHEEFDGELFDLNTGLYDADVGQNVLPGALTFCNCQFEIIAPGFDQ